MFNPSNSPKFGQRTLGDITINPHEAFVGYPVEVFISQFDVNQNILFSVFHSESKQYLYNQQYLLENTLSKVVLNTEGYPKGEFLVKVIGLVRQRDSYAEAVFSIK